jgi:hypothetical protein
LDEVENYPRTPSADTVQGTTRPQCCPALSTFLPGLVIIPLACNLTVRILISHSTYTMVEGTDMEVGHLSRDFVTCLLISVVYIIAICCSFDTTTTFCLFLPVCSILNPTCIRISLFVSLPRKAPEQTCLVCLRFFLFLLRGAPGFELRRLG